MTLHEKLNLLWKFLFLAVFSYGVFSLTCCAKSCSAAQCGKAGAASVQKQCGVNCAKACCVKN